MENAISPDQCLIDLLDQKAKDYVKFLEKVCLQENFKEIVSLIFTDNVKKIANGKELLNESQGLINQLENVQEACGICSIELLEVMVSAKQDAALVRYKFNTEKAGNFITHAVLRFDQVQKIGEIQEVFNQFDNGW